MHAAREHGARRGLTMPTFAAFVADALQAPARDGRYLLLDAAPTHRRNVASELGLISRSIDLLTGEECDWARTASPILLVLRAGVPLPHQTSRLVGWLQNWRYANCVSYFESDLPPDELIRALMSRTQARLTPSIPVLLRFYDCRVLPGFLAHLTPEDRAAFTSFATAWVYPDRSGEATTIPIVAGRHVPFGPFQVSQTMESAMVEASEADAIVHLMVEQGKSIAELLPPEQHRLVSEALAGAKQLGLTATPDLAAFCSLWIDEGPNFHQREAWSSKLMGHLQSGRSFTSLLDEIEESNGA